VANAKRALKQGSRDNDVMPAPRFEGPKELAKPVEKSNEPIVEEKKEEAVEVLDTKEKAPTPALDIPASATAAPATPAQDAAAPATAAPATTAQATPKAKQVTDIKDLNPPKDTGLMMEIQGDKLNIDLEEIFNQVTR
jgi:hypothetical protein